MTGQSLNDFADRRLRLAGSAILKTDNPWFLAIDEAAAAHAANGKSFISFSSYDYLGLARHPDVHAAVIEALQRHGPTVSGSRLVGGERSFHDLFERELADFLGFEASLTLVSAYLANTSLIPQLVGAADLLVYDELCHNSLLKGISASKAKAVKFAHNDMDDLDAILSAHAGQFRRCMIVAEGLYSMDGDVPDLERLVELKHRHGAWLFLDEAHSIGVIGKTGRGLCEHAGVDPREIDVLTGSLSKTFVSSGGFICASRKVIDWLKFTLPGFVYSVGLSPITHAAARAALTVLRREPERVALLNERSARFRDRAKAAGLNTGVALGSGIIPVLLNGPAETLAVGRHLIEKGYYAPAVVIVGIPGDQPRIRFFLSASHTNDEIDGVIDTIERALCSVSPNKSDKAAAPAGG